MRQCVALVGTAQLPSASFRGRKTAMRRDVHRYSLPDLVMVALARVSGVADYLAAFAQPPSMVVQTLGSEAWGTLAQALVFAASGLESKLSDYHFGPAHSKKKQQNPDPTRSCEEGPNGFLQHLLLAVAPRL